MKRYVFVLFSAVALLSGCATKGYVRNTVDPVQAKVDQVAQQVTQQGTELQQTQQAVGRNTTAISATDEKATAADRRAGEAANAANQADQKATQNNQRITALRQTVLSLQDYKVVNQGTVLFALNSTALEPQYKQQLDQVAARAAMLKRYFISIEGYTDQSGDASYNLDLSKRRAEAVVQYLAGERGVDFNFIHTIGFGEQKPTETDSSAEARARNRRVEVKIYSADEALATLAGSN